MDLPSAEPLRPTEASASEMYAQLGDAMLCLQELRALKWLSPAEYEAERRLLLHPDGAAAARLELRLDVPVAQELSRPEIADALRRLRTHRGFGGRPADAA